MNINTLLNNLYALIGSVLTISGDGEVKWIVATGFSVTYKSKNNISSHIDIINIKDGGYMGIWLVDDEFDGFVHYDRRSDSVILWRKLK